MTDYSNRAWCHNCREYHVAADESEDVDELVQQCEAGNWE